LVSGCAFHGDASSQYQRKNVRHVYDALMAVASGAGSALADPRAVALFVPQLLAKWQARCRCAPFSPRHRT
jgi:hypothetical protein